MKILIMILIVIASTISAQAYVEGIGGGAPDTIDCMSMKRGDKLPQGGCATSNAAFADGMQKCTERKSKENPQSRTILKECGEEVAEAIKNNH